MNTEFEKTGGYLDVNVIHSKEEICSSGGVIDINVTSSKNLIILSS